MYAFEKRTSMETWYRCPVNVVSTNRTLFNARVFRIMCLRPRRFTSPIREKNTSREYHWGNSSRFLSFLFLVSVRSKLTTRKLQGYSCSTYFATSLKFSRWLNAVDCCCLSLLLSLSFWSCLSSPNPRGPLLFRNAIIKLNSIICFVYRWPLNEVIYRIRVYRARVKIYWKSSRFNCNSTNCLFVFHYALVKLHRLSFVACTLLRVW